MVLLAASGLVLFLRFHHAPFRVTGVVISQQARTGCGVDVTGRITTNGSAGTVSYQPPVFSVTRELWTDDFRGAVSWGFAARCLVDGCGGVHLPGAAPGRPG
ncbi:MAG TPA: hypothetical protein VMV92_23915, partial [Streptosporangiaceae bacterium]|nr:hypothetical protein [Streptosporangiaceae bacterium]